VGGSGGLFVFDGLQFGGIVIVGAVIVGEGGCGCGCAVVSMAVAGVVMGGCGVGAVFYLIRYIILLCCLYYFNLLNVKMK